MIRALIFLAFAAAQTGCGGCGKWDLDLERMINQPRFTSYQACDVCARGSIMLTPPAGTVSRSQTLGPLALVHGRVDGNYLQQLPIRVDRGVLARGRNRFDIYCAACHGRLGDGISQVAENMKLRKPADLLVAPYTDYPPGRLFLTITDGYGLMRSYAGELPLDDRWAVVAYVKVLQLSQHVALGEIPPARREEARRWLK
ncbi:MAG: c-type cytochrome [Acidobacteriota bacterium]